MLLPRIARFALTIAIAATSVCEWCELLGACARTQSPNAHRNSHSRPRSASRAGDASEQLRFGCPSRPVVGWGFRRSAPLWSLKRASAVLGHSLPQHFEPGRDHGLYRVGPPVRWTGKVCMQRTVWGHHASRHPGTRHTCLSGRRSANRADALTQPGWCVWLSALCSSLACERKPPRCALHGACNPHQRHLEWNRRASLPYNRAREGERLASMDDLAAYPGKTTTLRGTYTMQHGSQPLDWETGASAKREKKHTGDSTCNPKARGLITQSVVFVMDKPRPPRPVSRRAAGTWLHPPCRLSLAGGPTPSRARTQEALASWSCRRSPTRNSKGIAPGHAGHDNSKTRQDPREAIASSSQQNSTSNARRQPREGGTLTSTEQATTQAFAAPGPWPLSGDGSKRHWRAMINERLDNTPPSPSDIRYLTGCSRCWSTTCNDGGPERHTSEKYSEASTERCTTRASQGPNTAPHCATSQTLGGATH